MGDGPEPPDVQAQDARGRRVLHLPARETGERELNGLIVTADDFGLSVEVNRAVERAHLEGILTAASLMVAGPAADDAVATARRLPRLRVGLHLVLSDGPPASPPGEISRLIDRHGQLRTMGWAAFAHAFNPRVRTQYAAEIAAQFTAFRRTGLTLDHVNAHKHFHVHPGLARQVLATGLENGMKAMRLPREPLAPLRRIEPVRSPLSVRIMRPWTERLGRLAAEAGLRVADATFGLRWTGAMTAWRLAGLIERLPPGLVEIYLHPATGNDFPGAAPGYRYTDEFNALTDVGVARMIRQSGRIPGGYLDFLT